METSEADGEAMATAVEADLVASWVLVTVTVAFPEEAGAANKPLVLMLPAEEDQVTLCRQPGLAQVTVAENCTVAPT
jgi:hypothetical protein